jgi:hypothetical protein
MGNQWVTSQAPGSPRNRDLLYFTVLQVGTASWGASANSPPTHPSPPTPPPPTPTPAPRPCRSTCAAWSLASRRLLGLVLDWWVE